MGSPFTFWSLRICSAFRLVITLLIAASLANEALAEPTPNLFYDMSVELTDSGKTIEVDLSICYEGYEDNLSAFYLLTGLATVKSIDLVGGSATRPLEWSHSSSDTLRIRFSGSESRTMNACIRIQYALPCGEEPYSDIILRRENQWYPVLPSSPFRYRLEYKTPEIYTVLSSGHKVHEDLVGAIRKGVWLQMHATFTLPLLFLNRSLLTTHEIESSNGVTIRYYGYSNIDSTILSILNTCAQSLDYFEEALCPYPYSLLHVIEVRDFPAVQSLGGMLLVGEMSIKYYWYEGFSDWPGHEVAHQWIGNIVLTNSLPVGPGRLFVEESLAEYLRISFLRDAKGDKAADSVLGTYRLETRSLAEDYSGSSLYDLSSIDNRDAGKVVYRYGPLVLSELEEYLGNDKWHVLLRTVMNRYRFKPFTYQLLQETLLSTTGDSAATALLDSLITGTMDQFQDRQER